MRRLRGAGALRSRVGRGQRWSAAERERYLAEFAASGLSAAAFVRKTGLPHSTFDLWRSEARRQRVRPGSVRKKSKTSGFARVAVVRPPSPSGITLVARSAAGVVAELAGLDAVSATSLLGVTLR
jgi:hypothetical protein